MHLTARRITAARNTRTAAAIASLALSGAAWAAPVPVTNFSFEDTTGTTFGTPANVGTTNEAFTNPSSFGPGWQLTGQAGTNGRYGLQQPRSGTGTNQLYYQRSQPAGTTPPGSLNGPFAGNLIGFINLDDIDGGTAPNYAQSALVGNLQPGTYTLTVAVGARANQNWNDIRYGIGLVSNPTSTGGNGTTAGTFLGTEATTVMMPPSSPPGSNIRDLVYTLSVPERDALVGAPYAIRITGTNLGTQNGIPNADPSNLTFVQANFDNVRLDFAAVPEPSTLGLALAATALTLRRRPRRA